MNIMDNIFVHNIHYDIYSETVEHNLKLITSTCLKQEHHFRIIEINQ